MARRKVLFAIGYSNMEGAGLLSQLATIGGSKWLRPGPYSNLYVYQNNVVDGLSTAGRLTPVEFAVSQFDGPPVSAFDYPPISTTPLITAYPQTFGPMLECMWRIQNTLAEPLYTVQLATPGSSLARLEPDNTVMGTRRDWWFSNATVSWHPGLPHVHPPYTVTATNDTGTANAAVSFTATTMTDTREAWDVDEHVNRYVLADGKEALITSNTPDTLTCSNGWFFGTPANGVAWTIETRQFFATSLARIAVEDYLVAANALMSPDTADVVGICISLGALSEEEYVETTYDSAKALIAYLRDEIHSRGLSLTPRDQIPVVWGCDVQPSVFTFSAEAAAEIARIAEEDEYFTDLDMTQFEYGGQTGLDMAHLSAQGCYDAGAAYAEAILAHRAQLATATTEAGKRLTLSALRTRVSRRYTRNANSTNPTPQQLNQFINDSHREVYNTLGDNCWFTRRIETHTVTGGPTTVTTLPASIDRLLRIEDPNCPGMEVKWRGIGYASSGRLQIRFVDRAGGTFNFHHIVIPPDLENDTDVSIIPASYLELVEVLTCYRLSAASGNAMQMAFYDGELERLWKFVKRDALRYDRHRQAALETDDSSFEDWNRSVIQSDPQ